MPKSRKIAVFATEHVTGEIGGVGIRQLEVARELSRHFEVRLFTDFRIGPHKERFRIEPVNYELPHTLEEPVRWADVVYSIQLNVVPFTQKYHKPLVIDLLVHEYFEDLEYLPIESMDARENAVYFGNCITRLTRMLTAGDFFLCPSERGRDYYLGVLTLLGKLRPEDYLEDPLFHSLIATAPFGIQKRKPRTGKNLIRGKVPGVGMKDFLIVWGGSLANWFDCLTPVRAMARLKKHCPRAKLVFAGKKHPVQGQMPAAYQDVVTLAKKLGVYNKNVFFYSDWVPYNQRDYYLTEADAGIVTFYDHIENRFSFRIRMLDYLWANLPILTNPGGVQSELVDSKELGRVVPFENHKALAEAIEWMATHPAARSKIRKKIAEEKKHFHWDKVLAPLVRFCRNPKKSWSLYNEDSSAHQKPASGQESTDGKLLRLMPSHPFLQPARARLKINEDKWEEAAEIIRQHMRLFGEGLENALFRLPLLDAPSEFTFEELLRLAPSHPQAQLMKAKLKMDDNQFAEAAALIEEEVSVFGERFETLLCRGLLYKRQGLFEKAAEELQQVRAALPERIEYWLPLAECWAELGEVKKARKLYTQVWSRSKPHAAAQWIRVRAALSIAKLDSRERPERETLRRFLGFDMRDEKLAYALGSALEQEGRLDDARSLFEQCATTFKQNHLRGAVWFRLARLSPKSKQPRMLDKCLQFHPTHSGAQKLLRELKANPRSARTDHGV